MAKKKKIRLTKQGKIVFASLAAVLFLILGALFYFKTRPLVVFYHHSIEVEINGSFEPLEQIKKVRKGKIEEVSADISQIDFKTLGEYEAIYTYHNHQYCLDVEIVDKTAPTFKVKEGTTDATVDVDPSTLVYDIKDATKTTVTLKEEYDFDDEGTIEVVVVVTDEGGNSTEKKTKVKILPKDTEKPKISGEASITLQKGAKFDPLESISVKDNQDPAPKLSILKSDVDINEIGEYEVQYECIDRSGNIATFTKKVTIVERNKIGRDSSNGENIVYLTFDDGPSYNTSKILDILDEHNVKATFFVTGNGQAYNQNIKRAYDAGHTIGLHTYSHNYGKVYASKENYFKDLKQVSDMVEDITGKKSHYIRFPGGSSNTVSADYTKNIMTELSKDVLDRGYQYYDWNISSEDATGNNISTSRIIEAATRADEGNVIILFHDASNKDTTVEALPKIIEHYKRLGFRFSAITDESYTCHHGINN